MRSKYWGGGGGGSVCRPQDITQGHVASLSLFIFELLSVSVNKRVEYYYFRAL